MTTLSSTRDSKTSNRARSSFSVSDFLIPVAPFIGLFLLWIVAWQVIQPPLATFPSVGEVVTAFTKMLKDGSLWANVSASGSRWIIGFFVGAVSGIAFGVLVGLNRWAARFFEPLAIFFTAMSGIAWIPLAIVWFGIGTTNVVFVIWNSVFFLVFSNVLLGVRSAPPIYGQAARTLGATRTQIVSHVIIPAALPYTLTGLRAGAGYGLRALVAAEIIGAAEGIGAMIYHANEFLRSDIIVTGIILFGVIGLSIDYTIAAVEKRTVERWGMVVTKGNK